MDDPDSRPLSVWTASIDPSQFSEADMNPELQKQLAEMLAKLSDAATQGGAWAGQQIPILVQEKVTFGRFDETLQLLLVGACLAAFVWMTRFMWKHLQDCDEEIGWILGTIVGGLGAFGCMVAFSTQITLFLMVWFAPRLYIVEWLKTMVSK